MSGMGERLRILLDYWIDHNHEHENDFREWADKAAYLSHEVTQQLQAAADRMAAACNDLEKARLALIKSMEGR